MERKFTKEIEEINLSFYSAKILSLGHFYPQNFIIYYTLLQEREREVEEKKRI